MEHFLQQFENFGHAKQKPQPVTARDSLKSPKKAQQDPKMFHFFHWGSSQAKKKKKWKWIQNEGRKKKNDFQMNFKNEGKNNNNNKQKK